MIKRSVFIQNAAYLSTKNEQLVIEITNDETTGRKINTIPLEDLGFVVLENPQITLTHKLLSKFAQFQVVCFSVDEKYMPNGLFQSFAGNSLSSMVAKNQINVSQPINKALWKQIISSKIEQQALALEWYKKRHERLYVLSQKVKSGDIGNLEAQAASLYWGELFSELANFKRDPDGDFPNSFLNYGYAILRGVVARAIVATGLLPIVGIHHRNKYNHFCLADDLMEPYRPYIDMAVCRMIEVGGDVKQELTTSNKAELIRLIVRDVWIEEKIRPLMNAVYLTVHSLVDVYMGKTRALKLPRIIIDEE